MKKYIGIRQAIELSKKFGVELTEKSFDKIKNGGFIFKKLNEETGKETSYFLKRYFRQTFDFSYSCHKDTKKGKELIMSNIPMPDIRKFLN